jgi:hypothetical protein
LVIGLETRPEIERADPVVLETAFCAAGACPPLATLTTPFLVSCAPQFSQKSSPGLGIIPQFLHCNPAAEATTGVAALFEGGIIGLPAITLRTTPQLSQKSSFGETLTPQLGQFMTHPH